MSGALAQQNPTTGMVGYFLPLYAIEDQRYTVYWPVGGTSEHPHV